MTPTIYTFGDFETIHWGLHAVAALFDPGNSSLLLGYNLLGLGAAVGVGCLITLLIGLIRGIMGQSLNVHEVLIGITVFTMLFVPKTRVQIEDYPTGRVSAVDHVPIGVAYTAAGISSAFVGFAEKMDTMFQMADSYYPTLSQEHFLSSLNLLAGIDWTVEGVKRVMPHMSQNLGMYIRFCVDNQVGSRDILQRPNGIQTMLNSPRPGGMVNYYAADGQVFPTNCPGLASRIQTDISSVFAATPTSENDFVKMVTRGTDAAQKTEYEGGTPSETYTDKAVDALDRIKIAAQLGMSDSAGDLLAMVYGKYIQSSMRCAYEPTHADFSNCVIREGETMYRRLAGLHARSQGLISGLMSNMSKLAFVFYVVSPVVALVIGLLGLRGIKAAGAWLVLGINAHAPLVIAPIGNFYAWKQAVAALKTVAAGTGITIANTPAVIEAMLNAVDNGMTVIEGGGLLLVSLATGSGMMLSRMMSKQGSITDNISSAASHGSGTGMNLYSPASMFASTPAGQMSGGGMWHLTPSGGGAGVFVPSGGGGAGVFGGSAQGFGSGLFGGGGPSAITPDGAPGETVSTGTMLESTAAAQQKYAQTEQAKVAESVNRLMDAARSVSSRLAGSSQTSASGGERVGSGQHQTVSTEMGSSVGGEQALREAVIAAAEQTESNTKDVSGGISLPLIGKALGVDAGTGAKTSWTADRSDTGQHMTSTDTKMATSAADRATVQEGTQTGKSAEYNERLVRELANDKTFQSALRDLAQHQQNYEKASQAAREYSDAARQAKSLGYDTKVNIAQALSGAVVPGSSRHGGYSAMMRDIMGAAQVLPTLGAAMEKETGMARALGYRPGMAEGMGAVRAVLGYMPQGNETAEQLAQLARAKEAVTGFLLGKSDAGSLGMGIAEKIGNAAGTLSQAVAGDMRARQDAIRQGGADITQSHNDMQAMFRTPNVRGGFEAFSRKIDGVDSRQMETAMNTLGGILGRIDQRMEEELRGQATRNASSGASLEQKDADIRAREDRLNAFREGLRAFEQAQSPQDRFGIARNLILQYGDANDRKQVDAATKFFGGGGGKGLSSAAPGIASRIFESNNNPGAVGNPNGRASYGMYQFDAVAGTPQSFVQWLQQHQDPMAREYGNRLASHNDVRDAHGNFAKEWKAIAASDPEGFATLQQQFAEKEYFAPLREKLADKEIDFNRLSRGTQEALYSAAIQHGVKGASELTESALRDLASGTEGTALRQFYAERTAKYARDNPALQRRYQDEYRMAASMSNSGASGQLAGYFPHDPHSGRPLNGKDGLLNAMGVWAPESPAAEKPQEPIQGWAKSRDQSPTEARAQNEGQSGRQPQGEGRQGDSMQSLKGDGQPFNLSSVQGTPYPFHAAQAPGGHDRNDAPGRQQDYRQPQGEGRQGDSMQSPKGNEGIGMMLASNTPAQEIPQGQPVDTGDDGQPSNGTHSRNEVSGGQGQSEQRSREDRNDLDDRPDGRPLTGNQESSGTRNKRQEVPGTEHYGAAQQDQGQPSAPESGTFQQYASAPESGTFQQPDVPQAQSPTEGTGMMLASNASAQEASQGGVLNTGDGGVLNAKQAEFSTPFSNDMASLGPPSDASSAQVLAQVMGQAGGIGSNPEGPSGSSSGSGGNASMPGSAGKGTSSVPGDSGTPAGQRSSVPPRSFA